MNVVLFGVNQNLMDCIPMLEKMEDIHVIKIVSNQCQYDDLVSINGKEYESESVSVIQNTEFDLILIFVRTFPKIYAQLKLGYKIEAEKIICEGKKWIASQYLQQKYKDTKNDDIQKNIEFLKNHSLDEHGIFGPEFIQDYSIHEVYWDVVENYPYIILEDKRMYYPNTATFEIFEGKQIVRNVLAEQQEHSPHLYITDKCMVSEGDVLLDAGACEGNFALRYIEKVKKCYLVECDKNWIKPLELTFAPFKNKTILCKKYISNKINNTSITIDELIDGGRLDFLKMDIEGAEVSALQGAEKSFCSNDVKCSVCAYHKRTDREEIECILDQYGYRTSVSEGHMLFWHDGNWWRDPDYRKGIVYAAK